MAWSSEFNFEDHWWKWLNRLKLNMKLKVKTKILIENNETSGHNWNNEIALWFFEIIKLATTWLQNECRPSWLHDGKRHELHDVWFYGSDKLSTLLSAREFKHRWINGKDSVGSSKSTRNYSIKFSIAAFIFGLWSAMTFAIAYNGYEWIT